MRNMSFLLTIPQFIDGSKTVTRRLRWMTLKPGDELMAVEKGMGLKPGEKIQRLGKIRVVSVRREELLAIVHDPEDCSREGFPDMEPLEFVSMFCKHMKCEPNTVVTRIEFEKIEVSP